MVTIKLFGLLKTLADNRTELSLSLDGGRTVGELVALLDARYPKIGDLIRQKKVLVSVNHDIAHAQSVVQDDDEVALLPPFAGGAGRGGPSGDGSDADLLVRVQRENFSIDAELDRVRRRSPRIGGIAIFLGTARDHSKGHEVRSITFEYYEGMAQKKLLEIRERALAQFDVIEVLILHRYGDIQIGENIVLVIAAAEHRADAFKACRWAIDELKQITPIWKLEHTPAGEVWVEEHP
jgi:molybdopterin synthase catalytic subunit